jgi:hypothetical protein
MDLPVDHPEVMILAAQDLTVPQEVQGHMTAVVIQDHTAHLVQVLTVEEVIQDHTAHLVVQVHQAEAQVVDQVIEDSRI